MIVNVTIDEIAVSIDSDGDQGEGYAPDVMTDILSRAAREALALWMAANKWAEANYPTDAEDSDE